MALRSITIASDGLLRTPEGTLPLIIGVRGLLDIDVDIFQLICNFILYIDQGRVFGLEK